MAVLIAKASGLLTASTTWSTVDATSYLNAENGSEVLTAAYSDTRSSTFTPGAITIDGIAVKLSVRTGVTGTMSVSLYNDTLTADVAGTEVTINCADLPVAATADLNGGWIFFKFSSSVLLLAGNNYRVQAKTSDASQVSLFRNATADNICRALRTTTEAAPGAGDDMIICGEKTGAGAETAIVVTMDSEAATDYGAASTSLVTPSLAICDGGTLQYGTTAATNYILRQSGNVVIYSGGTFNIGTTDTPIPRGGSAVLEFDCAADGGFGLLVRNLGTFVAQGLSRTAAKLVDRCLLNTDEAIASTSLGVSADTGWLDNDEIAVASTTQTASQSEKGALNGNANASDMTVDGFAGAGGGLAAAHSGTSPTQAEVILLTRNVRVRAVTSTLVTYCCFKPTSIVDIDWCEFYYLGENATDKHGIDVQTISGSFNMQRSSIHDCEDAGFYINGTTADNITFSNNVMYLCGTTTSAHSLEVADATSGASIVINGNIVMRPTGTSTDCFRFADNGITCTNNTAVGSVGFGFNYTEAAPLGTNSGNTAHSCTSRGLSFAAIIAGGTITNFTAWRNTLEGILLSTASIHDLLFDGGVLFGNGTSNIAISTGPIVNVEFKNYILNGDSSFATTNGVGLTGVCINLKFTNCDFSTASGILTAHTNDFNVLGSEKYVCVLSQNCKLGASVEVLNQAGMLINSFIRSARHDQTAGSHKSFFKYGTIALDAATFHTAAPSEKLTPNNTTTRLESGMKKYAVANGGTITPSVWVRKSAAYDGAQPRLILKANPAAGIAADVVLDTMTVGVDTWEQLTAVSAAVTDDAVLEVCVDCILGTGGDVFVDDYS